MNPSTLSIKQLGRVIDEAKEQIQDRRARIANGSAKGLQRNLLYSQIENRQSIIRTAEHHVTHKQSDMIKNKAAGLGPGDDEEEVKQPEESVGAGSLAD